MHTSKTISKKAQRRIKNKVNNLPIWKVLPGKGNEQWYKYVFTSDLFDLQILLETLLEPWGGIHQPFKHIALLYKWNNDIPYICLAYEWNWYGEYLPSTFFASYMMNLEKCTLKGNPMMLNTNNGDLYCDRYRTFNQTITFDRQLVSKVHKRLLDFIIQNGYKPHKTEWKQIEKILLRIFNTNLMNPIVTIIHDLIGD